MIIDGASRQAMLASIDNSKEKLIDDDGMTKNKWR